MLISPLIDILLIAYFTSVLTFVLNKTFVDQEKLFELEKREKEIRKKLLEDERYMDEYNRILREKLVLVQSSLKTLLITTPIIIVLLFFVLPSIYDKYGVILNIFGIKLNWFGTYILFSIVMGLSMERIFRKIWWYHAKTSTSVEK